MLGPRRGRRGEGVPMPVTELGLQVLFRRGRGGREKGAERRDRKCQVTVA